MNDLTVITCTGDRPEAFKLCEEWVCSQTYTDFKWIVIDDGIESVFPKRRHCDYVIEKPDPGINTLKRNFNTALRAVTTPWVAVFEDDDYYAPNYLEEIVLGLQEGSEVVGVANVHYYNTIGKWRRIGNYSYAPLAFTAFHSKLIHTMYSAMRKGPYKTFDIAFWRLIARKNTPRVLIQHPGLCVGMKGMPGRGGIGIGHRKLESKVWKTDPSPYPKAQQLLGDAGFRHYMPFIKPTS